MDQEQRLPFQRMISGLICSFNLKEQGLFIKCIIPDSSTELSAVLAADAVPGYFDGLADLYDQLRFPQHEIIFKQKFLLLKIRHGPKIKQFNFPLSESKLSLEDEIVVLKEEKKNMKTIILELQMKIELLEEKVEDRDDFVSKYFKIKEQLEAMKEKCQCWKEIQKEKEQKRANIRKSSVDIMKPKKEEVKQDNVEQVKAHFQEQIEEIKKKLENPGKNEQSPLFKTSIDQFLDLYNQQNKTTHDTLASCQKTYETLREKFTQREKPSKKKFVEFFANINHTGHSYAINCNNEMYEKLFGVFASLFEESQKYIASHLEDLEFAEFENLDQVYSVMVNELTSMYSDIIYPIDEIRKDWRFINISLKNKSIIGNMWVGRLAMLADKFEQAMWKGQLKAKFKEFEALNKELAGK